MHMAWTSLDPENQLPIGVNVPSSHLSTIQFGASLHGV